MRYYTVSNGIVIRRSALPSGDVVVTLLNESGKWRAVARKGTLPGGNVGRLSLFHDVNVQYYRKRDDDLALLTQVQLNGALPNLTLPHVYPYAHLLAELADALTVDLHLGERLFEYLASGLRGLNVHPDPEHVALLYAWRLLGVAGFRPRLDVCLACGTRSGLVAFDLGAGGLTCSEHPRGEAVSATDLEGMRALVTLPLERALAEPPEERAAQWRLLHRYVAYHVQDLRSFAGLDEPIAARSQPHAARADA